jgi:hypothetical protein
MLKRFATIAVVMIVVGSNLFAAARNGGIARHISLGGSNFGTNIVLNPFIYDDPAFMLVNPAYQTWYSDYAWMNVAGGALTGLGAPDNGYGHQHSGISFGLDKEWNLGAILSYDPSAANAVSGLIPQLAQRTTQTIPAIQNVWEVVTSYDAGALDFGFGFMYGNSNADTSGSTTGGTSFNAEASSRVFGFRGGLLYDLGSGNSVDLSASLRLDKATDKISITPTINGTGGDYSASGTEFAFMARAKLKASNKFNFVPYGLITIISAEPKEDAPPTGVTATTNSLKVSATAFAFGVGGEYRTPSLYVAGGLSFQSAKLKAEGSNSATNSSATNSATITGFPVINLGAEWWFTDWLAGRAGYYRANHSINFKNEASGGGGSATGEGNHTIPNSLVAIGALNQFNNDGLVTLGLGLRFGAFALDGTVSEEALRRGFGVIGANDNINTFGYITISVNLQ